jgi:hypothetical protein
LVTVARFSNVVAAAVWIFGLPLTLMSAVPFTSDTTYFILGVVIVMLGLAATPLALAYPESLQAPLTRVVRGLGAIACLALILTGALLVSGSEGLLGERAPDWSFNALVISQIGFFVWILLASLSTRRSSSMGVWVFWLGVAASASVLIPNVLNALAIFVLGPNVVITNTSAQLAIATDFLIWLSLPAWLVALSARMRSGGTKTAKQLDAVQHQGITETQLPN